MDDDLGYRIYALEKPLQPGDSLQLSFEVHVAPHGFRNNGADAFVVQNGSLLHESGLVACYRLSAESRARWCRRSKAVWTRPTARRPIARRSRGAPDPSRRRPDHLRGDRGDERGSGRRCAGGAPPHVDGRRATLLPLRHGCTHQQSVSVCSPPTTRVHEEQWSPSAGSGQAVAIQIFHHPGHAGNLGRMVASVRASLDHYTRQFGPYPYSYIRLIENPARGMGVATEAATVEYGEGFSLLNPGNGPQDLDLVFAVVAHGVARGWWGMQVAPADVEGAGLLDVSLETYSAMRVVEETLGPEHLRRYLLSMREGFSPPRTRAAPPLLRATDSFACSRKGPFALYAMREYIGKERVDDALRSLLEKHGSGVPPLPTSLDLYRELQAVTPDPFQYLLHDLFEKNTFWELVTERATAQQTAAGAWQVTLDVRARKVVVDEAGIETEAPMDDWIEVGVFGGAEKSEESRNPLYMQLHRIRSGSQTITVTVPGKPTGAGIDPNNLLVDRDPENNIKNVR